MRLPRPLTIFVALVATLFTVPTALAQSDPAARAAVFAGTGLWVDIYDETIHDPSFVVAEAIAHDIDVIYVETSNDHSPADVM